MIDKEIREKYKQVKYQHLKKIFEKNLSKLPTNCKYNKVITFQNRHNLNICTFNLEDITEVDLCYKPEHSIDCNAFCPKKSKEELRNDFMDLLKDPQARATFFKDVNILYWLYPELEVEDFPKDTWYQRFSEWIKSLFR